MKKEINKDIWRKCNMEWSVKDTLVILLFAACYDFAVIQDLTLLKFISLALFILWCFAFTIYMLIPSDFFDNMIILRYKKIMKKLESD